MNIEVNNPSSNSLIAGEFTKCLLCNNQTLLPLKNYRQAHLIKCAKCEFVFSRLIPTVPALIAHYNTYPRTDTISPITLKRYNELCTYFERFRDTGNILDVGCGNGHFLAVAKMHGWNVFGTEYTDIAMAICKQKGIEMHQGKLDTSFFRDTKFDVITSFEVLEHINNPLEEVANFNTLLRSNGIVYVTTPNFNSLSRHYLKQKWNIIEYPEHLTYYTPATITRLFDKIGFLPLKIKTTGISLTRFQQSSGHVTSASDVKKIDENLREKTENNPFLAAIKKLANNTLTLTGTGDTIKAIFKKQV